MTSNHARRPEPASTKPAAAAGRHQITVMLAATANVLNTGPRVTSPVAFPTRLRRLLVLVPGLTWSRGASFAPPRRVQA